MSKMKKLPEDQRKFIEKLLREDRLTLNEMLDEIRAEFPAATIPSRSALGRAKQNFAAEAKRMREIQAAAEVLVAEFGEDVDDKAGALLTQAITTLTTDVVLTQLKNDGSDPEKPKIGIDDVGSLARASRAVIATRGMTLKQRQEIERMAREKLLKEQAERLEQISTEKGLDAEQLRFWREEFLGVR
ncbi:phage protein Gp27 family protein [Acinetobacter ursingii]|uniref:phage protein Gp27 family protein n=1 Tax=Acinetobacter ursingii TaxID=108980 RepID=UPI004033384C